MSWSTRSCDYCRDRGRSVAVAEWATDGLVSHWLAEAAGGERLLANWNRRARGGDAAEAARNRYRADGMLPRPETAQRYGSGRSIRSTGAEYGFGSCRFPGKGAESSPTATLHNMDMSGTLHVALCCRRQCTSEGFSRRHPSGDYENSLGEAGTEHAATGFAQRRIMNCHAERSEGSLARAD